MLLGDMMKKAYMIPVFASILIGFLIGKTMCDEYRTTGETKTVFQKTNSQTVYALQYGVYSTKENMDKNVANLSYYIYRVEDEKYHVYIGIAIKEENIKKIQDYFQKNGYVTYKKELMIKNQDYISKLQTFDAMLDKVSDDKTINDINQKALENYKEE